MKSYARPYRRWLDYFPDRCRLASVASGYRSELDTQQVRDLADDATAGQEDAGDADHTLDDRDPLVERIEVVLHRDDDECADHGTENRAEPADQRHQQAFAGLRPVTVGERRNLEQDGLGSSGDARGRRGEHEGAQLVTVGLVAKRD